MFEWFMVVITIALAVWLVKNDRQNDWPDDWKDCD
jgi:hypothetical protein